MKTMDRFCRIIAFFLLLSFVSCTSAPYTINGVPITGGAQSPQLRLLQLGGSSSPQTTQQPRQAQPAAQPASPYWTGDGGRGKSITILPPRPSSLTADQSYLPDFVANELVTNFDTFSAMTLFDRLNNQKQYNELLSGIYADDDKAGLDLGHLVSTDYMLVGDITKTSTGYALQLTILRNSDKTTAASYSGTVSIAELDNMIGVRRASLDLLQKMGVQLTAQARTELTKAPTTDQLSALTAMAQGIIAQRQGTEVAALTYFIQAAAFDTSLAEAVSRTNVLSANISTGNIGANVRNDFAWSDAWEAKLKETETLMNDMLRNTNPQRSVWYSPDLQEVESARDRTTRTTEFRTDAVLHTQAVFPVSVQKTVQAVYDGLQTTQRAQAWKFDGWPRQGRTNVNPFNKQWGGMISIAFEMLNERGQVIGQRTVEMDSRYSFSGTRLEGPGTAFTTVRFTGVKADDITDRISVRVASINGRPPEEAGISQIAPMFARQMQTSRSFTIYNGAIRPASNERNLGAVIIPFELWGERVTAIGNGAYENRGLTGVTIPDSVTSIGERAFANNEISSYKSGNSVTSIGNRAFYNAFSEKGRWEITIPNSVISIGNEAYAKNTITSVIIGDRVTTIGARAFADNHWTTRVQTSGGYETRHHGLTRVTIGNSVTSIGEEAFAYHWTTTTYSDGKSYTTDHWLVTEVTIGANVNIGKNAIGYDFETFYTSTGRQAGSYRYGAYFIEKAKWERFSSKEAMETTATKEDKGMRGIIIAAVVLLIGGVITWAILDPNFGKYGTTKSDS